MQTTTITIEIKPYAKVALGLAGVSYVVQTVGGWYMIKKYDQMRDIAQSLGKIAAYQNAMLNDLTIPDGFDTIVFEDMNQELEQRLKDIGYKQKPKEDSQD